MSASMATRHRSARAARSSLVPQISTCVAASATLTLAVPQDSVLRARLNVTPPPSPGFGAAAGGMAAPPVRRPLGESTDFEEDDEAEGGGAAASSAIDVASSHESGGLPLDAMRWSASGNVARTSASAADELWRRGQAVFPEEVFGAGSREDHLAFRESKRYVAERAAREAKHARPPPAPTTARASAKAPPSRKSWMDPETARLASIMGGGESVREYLMASVDSEF